MRTSVAGVLDCNSNQTRRERRHEARRAAVTLSHCSNFALLNALIENKVDGWRTGPDSLKLDRHGNLYVAQLFCGRVLKISPAGKLLHVFDLAAGNGPTNVAFDDGEKPRRAVCCLTANLYVSAIKDVKDPQCKGSIVKIPNVR